MPSRGAWGGRRGGLLARKVAGHGTRGPAARNSSWAADSEPENPGPGSGLAGLRLLAAPSGSAVRLSCRSLPDSAGDSSVRAGGLGRCAAADAAAQPGRLTVTVAGPGGRETPGPGRPGAGHGHGDFGRGASGTPGRRAANTTRFAGPMIP